jgi:hypothetical protein
MLAIADRLMAFLIGIQSIYLLYLFSEVDCELLLSNTRTETVL